MKHYYVAPERTVEEYLEDFRLGLIGGRMQWIHTHSDLTRLPYHFYLVSFEGDDGQLDYWERQWGVTPLANVMSGKSISDAALEEPLVTHHMDVLKHIGCCETHTTYEVSEVARKVHGGFRFNGV